MAEIGKDGIMAYEELFIDLLKAEREEDVTDALTVYGLEKFTDAHWIPYGGVENNFGLIGAPQADSLGALRGACPMPAGESAFNW